MSKIIKFQNITQLIYVIRGQKVVVDFDLSRMYGVENKYLKRQVRSNTKRFPNDFMFKLTSEEWKEVVQNLHHLGKARYTSSLPLAFTEQGVAMLSGVLRSDKAVEVNIAIMRAFVEMRYFIASNEDILKKITNLENDVKLEFFEQDKQISLVFETLKKMMLEDTSLNNRKIGFLADE